jgi:hypothetical protein
VNATLFWHIPLAQVGRLGVGPGQGATPPGACPQNEVETPHRPVGGDQAMSILTRNTGVSEHEMTLYDQVASGKGK